MKVTILKEAGYEEALLGLSLSFNRPWSEMVRVSKGLYNKDGGHNKFLESIYVWLEVTAPSYWWAEADTYRFSTQQPKSTIHNGLSRTLTTSAEKSLSRYLASLSSIVSPTASDILALLKIFKVFFVLYLSHNSNKE